MKVCLFVFSILFFFNLPHNGFSQEIYQPYTAKAYWTELNKPECRYLKQKQLTNEILLNTEKKWLQQYEEYLGDYFQLLPAKEKNTYYLNKGEWYAQADMIDIQPAGKEKPRRNTDLLLKHIGYSGLSGMTYGIMLNRIFELDEPMSIGLPMLLAGGSMMYPIFSPSCEFLSRKSHLYKNRYAWIYTTTDISEYEILNTYFCTHVKLVYEPFHHHTRVVFNYWLRKIFERYNRFERLYKQQS